MVGEILNEYRILKNDVQRDIIKRRAVDFIREAKDANTVIFLDKSARNFAELLTGLWPKYYPLRPLPRILNINIGNEKNLPSEVSAPWDAPKFIIAKNLAKSLYSEDQIRRLYGSKNVDDLLKELHSDKPECRLVVDDMSHSGRTSIIAKFIMMTLDPINTYNYFNFVENNDLGAFYVHNKGWITPWALKGDIDQMEDSNAFFVSKKVSNRLNNQKRFRRELQMLAGEIPLAL